MQHKLIDQLQGDERGAAHRERHYPQARLFVRPDPPHPTCGAPRATGRAVSSIHAVTTAVRRPRAFSCCHAATLWRDDRPALSPLLAGRAGSRRRRSVSARRRQDCWPVPSGGACSDGHVLTEPDTIRNCGAGSIDWTELVAVPFVATAGTAARRSTPSLLGPAARRGYGASHFEYLRRLRREHPAAEDREFITRAPARTRGEEALRVAPAPAGASK